MVKSIYIADYPKAIVTFYSYGKDLADRDNPLPFLSQVITPVQGSREVQVEADMLRLGYKYLNYNVSGCSNDVHGAFAKIEMSYKPVDVVEVDGVYVETKDTVIIDDVRYLKTDERIFYHATDDEWYFREDYEDFDDLIQIDDKFYREDDDDICETDSGWELKDNCFYCEHCDKWHYGSDYYNVRADSSHEETWCRDCVDEEAFWCNDCDEYYSTNYRDYYRTRGGDRICSRCRENNYCYCEECGEIVWYEDYDGEEECCVYCRDEHRSNRRVRSYHASHHDLIKYFKGDQEVEYNRDLKVFGFELEADDGEGADEVIGEIEELGCSRLISSFEHDGSLSSSGFETISYPIDIKTFNSADWESFLKCYQNHGYKSDQASNSCSLHMHFNRPAFFGYSVRAQENSIAKLYVFFRKYWDDLVKASRRKYLGWCDLDEDIKDCNPELSIIQERAEYCSKYKKNNNHRTAINQGNSSTIEIRLGKGTLNPKSFRAWIDLMYHVVNNIKKVPFARAHEGALWLKGISPATKEYLRKRKAFISIIGEENFNEPVQAESNILVAEPEE